MGPLVFGPIRGVAERLATAIDRAEVGLLAGMRSDMNLEILLPRESLVAAGMLGGGN